MARAKALIAGALVLTSLTGAAGKGCGEAGSGSGPGMNTGKQKPGPVVVTLNAEGVPPPFKVYWKHTRDDGTLIMEDIIKMRTPVYTKSRIIEANEVIVVQAYNDTDGKKQAFKCEITRKGVRIDFDTGGSPTGAVCTFRNVTYRGDT